MQHADAEIFSTVPDKDYMSIYEKKELKYDKIVEYYEFKKEDISKAAGVPISSVRYDAKMPAELQERIREWGTLLNLVAEHFKGDVHKTVTWVTTINPMLGGITPRDMIRFGRFQKLFKFVMNAINENKR